MKKYLMLFVLFAMMTGLALAQTVQIKGTVTSSEDGLTMPGVSVVAKGTSIGVVTGTDGKYTITVPERNQVLVFSFIGYKPQEVNATGQTTLDIVLDPDLFAVEEVVVVGYGVQKKREVTGAIAQVKGDAVANLATPSFESQLAGRSSGVQVTQQTGVLGETPRLRIRSIGSISSGTYPLIVVDGIPVFTGDLGGYASTNSLADINPADIETMEILKDGSATAIYGSRAANGVILITTKRGSASTGKFKMNYNNYFGIASPIQLFDLLETPDFILISNEKRFNAGQGRIAIDSTYNTDWQRAVLRTNAFQQDHNLSMSGATDKSSYYFSIGYTDMEGVTRPNEMRRFTVRSNVDQKVTKWLTVGTNIGVAQTETFGLNTGTNSLSGNIFSAIRQLPNTPIYDPADPTGYNIDVVPDYVGRWNNIQSIGDNLPNIVYVVDNNIYQSRVFRTIGSAFAQVNILPSLNFRTQASVDNSKTDGFLYWNATHGDGKSVNGRVQNNFDNGTRWNLQNILSYSETFADAHNLSITLVNEYQQQRWNSFNAVGTDLSNEFFRHNIISGTVGTMSVGGSLSENGFISYASRLNYNYKGKYFLQGSVRYDGISSLPEASKYGLFPGGSIGWTITREPFMEFITPILSDLKLRASYAEVGNVSIGNYPYLGLYGSAKYADYNGITFSQIGNDQLQWETSKKIDVGFDAMFMEGKYKLSFDYYVNDQDGLILATPIPMSLGVPGNSINKNVGALKSWGYEFSGEAFLVKTKDFAFAMEGNLTFAGNEIVSLVGGRDITYENVIVREGESIYSIYGYRYWGVNPANGNPVYYKADNTLVQGNIGAGTYHAFDPADPAAALGASTTLSSTLDKVVFGPSLPTYFGSVTTKFNYKGFDFTAMFRYSGGNFIMNSTRRDQVNLNFVNNSPEILGRWQSVAEPGDGWTPRLRFGDNTFSNLTGHATGRFIEKGNFVKLQTITLGYNMPKRWVNRVGVDNMRVFAQGQDIFMITKYTGIDPEMESTGTDLNGTPRQRVITFGINLSL